jgi:hypothetical protein
MLTNLKVLNLGDFSENITDEGITKLTNLTDLTRGFSSKSITNAGITVMGSHLKKFTDLCNNHDGVNENGLTNLTNLEELYIPTSIQRITSFAGFAQMTNLRVLEIGNRDWIDLAEYRMLKRSNYKLNILWKYCNNSNPTWR